MQKKLTYGNHLKNMNIAFVVLNKLNSYKAPELILKLKKYSCEIYPFILNSNKYVTKDTIKQVSGKRIEKLDKKYDAVIVYPAKKINDEIKNIVKNYKTSKIIYCHDECMEKIVRELSVSELRGKSILVTAGPTPVKIDNVRRITNKFSGKLGIEIANELYLRGADVMLYQSYSGIRPPKYIKHILFEDYDEYKHLCTTNCSKYKYGIFSAAVADYKPKYVFEGKIPSGGALETIEFTQTEKVINLVQEVNPDLKMISFKYEEGKTLEQLLEIADKRLKKGHIRVVANDITLNNKEQKCFLCGLNQNDNAVVLKETEGKVNIARMIADDLEQIVRGCG